MSTELMLFKMRYNIADYAIEDAYRIIEALGEPTLINVLSNTYILYYGSSYIRIFDLKIYNRRYSCGGCYSTMTNDLDEILSKFKGSV